MAPGRRYIEAIAGIALLLGLCGDAAATSVKLVRLAGDRAEVLIDASPRSLPVGHLTQEGVKLLGIGPNSATFEVAGRRFVLTPGQSNREVVLQADSRGHFITTVHLNGTPVSGLIDTGATVVAINEDVARQAGIDYRHGRQGTMRTANGVVTAYEVTLPSFRMGEIALGDVRAVVITGGRDKLDTVLIGMSALGRLEMTRSGTTLSLARR